MQPSGFKPTYGHSHRRAIAIGGDGTAYIDQKVEYKNGYRITSSKAPLSEKVSDVAKSKLQRSLIVDSVCGFLPCSNVVLSTDWNDYNESMLLNKQEKESVKTVRAVDVFGIMHSGLRKFIFRKVDDKDVELIFERLNKDIPSSEELEASVKEAIDLTEIPEYGVGRISWREIGPIAYYYLPTGTGELTITLDFETNLSFQATSIPVIFAYPIHPDVDMEKVGATLDLLQQLCGNTIKIESVQTHPVEIIEPPTMRSYP